MNTSKWLSFSPPSTYRKSLDEFFNNRYRKLLGFKDDFSPALNVARVKEN